jgi:hypothetical protein
VPLAAAAVLVVAAIAAAQVPAPPAGAQTLTVEFVNVDSAGVRSIGITRFPSVTDTGTTIAFDSMATGLVPGDTNNARDVFVRDRRAGTIRASLSDTGAEANNDSARPDIGRFGEAVTFVSHATNLVNGDTNGVEDVFVRRLFPTQGTVRASVSDTGAQADASSGDPQMSKGGGDVVSYTSRATNLVQGDTNGVADVFVHGKVFGTTTTLRVSVSSSGAEGNGPSWLSAISGRWVAFSSTADNLVPGDTNGREDVFIHDLAEGTTTRISVSSTGAQANGDSRDPSVNERGDVAFSSTATNLVPNDTNGFQDVFVSNVGPGGARTITRASVSSPQPGEPIQANGPSGDPSMPGYRYLAFRSSATNLVPGDTNLIDDVFRYDRLGGWTERWSVDSNGNQASVGVSTGQPAIDQYGSSIAFASDANNLVPGDTLLTQDVFQRHP